jgi:hypothetical protein
MTDALINPIGDNEMTDKEGLRSFNGFSMIFGIGSMASLMTIPFIPTPDAFNLVPGLFAFGFGIIPAGICAILSANSSLKYKSAKGSA